MVKHSIQRNGTMNMLNKNVFFLILTWLYDNDLKKN